MNVLEISINSMGNSGRFLGVLIGGPDGNRRVLDVFRFNLLAVAKLEAAKYGAYELLDKRAK